MQKRKLTATEIILLIILVLAIIGLCFLLAYLFQNLRPGRQADQTATQTAEAIEAGLCLKEGRLVVGTSADYPPYSTFANDYTLDGFDIALMREIAKYLELPVEFHNIAFEGLGSALKVNQINAAISAISVTPERQQEFAFSDIYFVDSSAILAQPGSTLAAITSLDQLVNSRLGVQSGTVYEAWVQSTLIQTGQMPAANLFRYPTIDLAINDLITGKLDLVLLDQGPARKFTDQGSAKLVNEGFTQQQYAIGLRQDCPILLEQINEALAELRNNGTLARLVESYLNLAPDEVVPVPTPAPPQPTATAPVTMVTPTTPPGCIDGMAFIQDLTFPSNGMVNPPVLPPGTPFQKGWRIRNTGTCVWNQQYFVGYAGGNSPYSQMGGVPTPIAGLVQPGQTYDLYINLVSPAVPGVYQGFWQMINPARLPFGERLMVGIQVPAPNPATPTLAPDAPRIYRFTVNPTSIQFGACVMINWQVTGNVSTVNLFRDDEPIWMNGPAAGNLQDCPARPGQIRYEIRATGPGGMGRAEQFVLVSETLPPTATPPPQPPPQIVAFDVQPGQVELGQCVNVSWTVNGTVDRLRLLRNGQVILDNAPNTGQVGDCPPSPGSVVYRLEATGAGQSASAERAVNVTQDSQQPTPPFADIQWLLVSYTDNQGVMVKAIEGVETTVVFSASGAIGGNGGCNQFSGRYTSKDGAMTVIVENSSKMNCPEPPGLMEQEQTFFSLLQSSQQYQMTADQLLLITPGSQRYLVFKPGIQPR
jgi:polar amino acid transport system substrate-binding protein